MRKAAVILSFGLSLLFALGANSIEKGEKFTNFAVQPVIPIQTTVNTEPIGDSGQPASTGPNKDSSSKVLHHPENREPANWLVGLRAESTTRPPNTHAKTLFLKEDPPENGIYPFVVDVYTHQNSRVKKAVSAAPEVDSETIAEASANVSQPAPGVSPGPERDVSSTEEPKPSQQIVPLEVTPRAARPASQLGLTPGGYTGRYFHLARPRLGLGLAYEFQEERREGRDSDTDSKVKSDEFKQRLALETNGWVYHPALCKYTLRFDPEWTQVKRVSDPGETSTDTTFEPFYAIDAYFLEPKPYTLHGFAERREIKLRSAFTAETDTTIDKYGGDLRLKYIVLPTILKYTRTDTDQSGFFESKGERDDYQLTSRHVTSRSTTSLTGSYSDDERTSGGVTTRIKNFTGDLGNDLDIAGDRRKMLYSNLSYRWTESDTSKDTFFQFRENFFWRHTPKLYTDYLLSFETSDANNFDRDTGTLRAKLQHLLYENLTTTVQAGAVLNDSTAGRENIYDGNLDLLYQRKIPWGMLNLRANLDYTFTDREGFDEDFVQVTDEPHALVTGDVTLLDNQNVDLDSIAVTDVTGTVLYIENVDYTVQEIDSSVQISRTLVGAIADGQTVLVDYRFLSDPNFDDSVFGQAYDIQLYLWNALTLRYGYLRTDQNIVSGTPPENRVDDRAHVAEIRLNLGWTDSRFTYEDTERSSGVSTTEWLASQTFRVRPVRRFLTEATGSYGWTDFKDRGETQDQYGLTGRLFWVPAGWCRFRVEGSWQKISGDVQDTEDTNVTAALELSYRIWSGGIYYRLSDLRNNDQKQIKNELRVEIIRLLW